MPPSVNDLNLPHNPFNVLATVAVIRPDEKYSPQSLEPSILSPILTPSMNLSTIEGWEAPNTTTDDNTYYSEGEPRRDISPNETFDSNEPRQVSSASSTSSKPPLPPQQKKKRRIEMSFPQKENVAAYMRGMRPAPTIHKTTLIIREELKL